MNPFAISTAVSVIAFGRLTALLMLAMQLLRWSEVSAVPVSFGQLSVLGTSPSSGSVAGGTSITITGTGFSGARAVTFGGVRSPSVRVINATTLVVVTPRHVEGFADITVTTPGAQATGQGMFCYVGAPPGPLEGWALRSPPGVSVSAAVCDADGQRLVVTDGTFVWLSADAGNTWARSAKIGTGSHVSLAASTDGKVLFAALGGSAAGVIWSSIDFGTTWAQQTPQLKSDWASIAASGEGQRVTVFSSTGEVVTSGDGGATWQSSHLPANVGFAFGAASVKGKKLFASTNRASVLVSSDLGVSWVERFIPATLYSGMIACAADGSKLAALAYTTSSLGAIMTSADSGAHWTRRTPVAGAAWTAITSSADGRRLAATSVQNGVDAGAVWTSADFGLTWIQHLNTLGTDWVDVGTSADGNRVFAISTERQLWCTDPHAPTLASISLAEGSVAGGYSLTLGGKNFTVPATVMFGGVAATDVTFVDESMLSVTVPPHGVGEVDVSVTTGTGSATGAGFFSYTATPAPAGETSKVQTVGTELVAIASSADGNKLVLAEDAGTVQTSLDAGATWRMALAPGAEHLVAASSSSDGSHLAVASRTFSAVGATIWTSADSGSSWTAHNPAGLISWSALACSATGTKLVALGYRQNQPTLVTVWTSADAGTSWVQRTTARVRNWRSVASSADGSKIAAVVSGGSVWTSADSGATWAEQTSAGTRGWTSIACSADGDKLVASEDIAGAGGVVWMSQDGGLTWIARPTTGDKATLACSADGIRIAVAPLLGSIITSADGGVTWSQRTTTPRDSWRGIATSADGTKLTALAATNTVWTSDGGSIKINLPATQPALNRRTGLYEWPVQVTNLSQGPLTGFDLSISGLPANVAVWNAVANTGGSAPSYSVHHGAPISPGASVSVVIEYFSMRGAMPALTATVDLKVVPSDASPSFGTFGKPVLASTRIPGLGNLVQFDTVPGKRYRIWYSVPAVRSLSITATTIAPGPLQGWLACPSLMLATSTRAFWMDEGPPKTISSPLNDPARQYRVELVVDQK